MIFIDIEEFYEKASAYARLTRQEEIEYAKAMNAGDTTAREKLIQSYIPMVAG